MKLNFQKFHNSVTTFPVMEKSEAEKLHEKRVALTLRLVRDCFSPTEMEAVSDEELEDAILNASSVIKEFRFRDNLYTFLSEKIIKAKALRNRKRLLL